MSLDKQRILSELGSVMNQLQSTDCGCMGKLFSSPGQESPGVGAPLPTCGGCRRGCCRGHGFGTPCAGDTGGMNGYPCMGRCNPSRLYADTYGYLNQNLMQPVVKEVYDDLSSITPANTIGNNPLAKQMMGLGQGNPMEPMGGQNMMHGGGMGNPNMGGMPATNNGMDNPNANQQMGQMSGDPMSGVGGGSMGGMGGGSMSGMGGRGPMGGMGGGPMGGMGGGPMGGMGGNPAGGMGGMGSQIVNMMMSGGGGRPTGMPAQGDQLNEPMLIDAPQSPHGQVGVTPLNAAIGRNMGHFGGRSMGMPSMGQGDPSVNQAQYNKGNMGQENMGAQMQVPTTQYVTQDNTYTVGNAQVNTTIPGSMGMVHNMNPAAQNLNPGAQNMNPGTQQPGAGFMNPSPAAQPMRNANNAYGQHTPGITKFNEMFPGVMQGGQLGFDPMAIAIQMNPANQQRAAMETMQKLMNNKPLGGSANMGQLNQPQQNLMQNQIPQTAMAANQMANQQIVQSQPGLAPTGQIENQQMMQGQQQVAVPNAGAVAQPNQQQVYSAITGAPTMNQQQLQGRQIIDPNTGVVTNSPASYEGMAGDPNDQMQQPPPTEGSPPPAQEMYKEPIFPADTSRNPPVHYMKPQSHYQYNTLGQPIQMLPGNAYHTQDPGLPQTLSPQPTMKSRNDLGRLSVKGTMSKTSIVGNRAIGKNPSRSQLQHIYRQYKGSQSNTQQNVRIPSQGISHSDGKLYAAPAYANPAHQIPVEKVGGDTTANNQMNNQIVNKVEVGQIGDVPAANKPQGDTIEKASPTKLSHLRNGLQDMVFSTYPSNASWTFHGEFQPAPVSAAFRTRRRV